MIRTANITSGKHMKKIDSSRLPDHVAIIMDGNGRWAEKKALSRIKGHRAGAEAVRRVVTASRELGLRYLTLYAFSVENWLRPQGEVGALMRLLNEFIKKELSTMVAHNIRFNTIGNRASLPEAIRGTLAGAMEKTRNNDGMVLTLALSYGGRDEILRAVQHISEDFRAGKLGTASLSVDAFSHYLDTSGMPDPDLIIRTSGEYRLSNFLIWQAAYAEFYFTDVLWPDFDKEHLIAAIAAFQKRERRFGLTREQLKA